MDSTHSPSSSAQTSTPARHGPSWFGRFAFVLVIGATIAFFVMIAAIAGAVSSLTNDTVADTRPHLVELRLEGPIYQAEPTLAILRRLREDKQCKGVLLRIESPGGAVGASQEILAALRGLRESGIPLVVSFGNVAASGGYYVALAGEKIFANPGTLTGSIGVIFQFPELEKLMEKAGVSLQTVKSGALKDVGSPARKATAEELRFLQQVIDDTYDQFLNDVATGRNLPVDSLRALADGRVFTGRQAVAAGLVDTLGGVDDARAWLVARADVPADIRWTLEPRPRSRLEQFMSPEAGEGLGGLLGGLRNRLNPGTFFLWP